MSSAVRTYIHQNRKSLKQLHFSAHKMVLKAMCSKKWNPFARKHDSLPRELNEIVDEADAYVLGAPFALLGCKWLHQGLRRNGRRHDIVQGEKSNET